MRRHQTLAGWVALLVFVVAAVNWLHAGMPHPHWWALATTALILLWSIEEKL